MGRVTAIGARVAGSSANSRAASTSSSRPRDSPDISPAPSPSKLTDEPTNEINHLFSSSKRYKPKKRISDRSLTGSSKRPHSSERGIDGERVPSNEGEPIEDPGEQGDLEEGGGGHYRGGRETDPLLGNGKGEPSTRADRHHRHPDNYGDVLGKRRNSKLQWLWGRGDKAYKDGSSDRRRRMTNGLFGCLLIGIIVAIVLIIVSDLTRRKEQEDDASTPDLTKLPPPAPGLRNPAYLVSGHNGAVASEVEVCSDIGITILREGGTATDAGIASALCVGIVNSFSSGIGGGGFAVVRGRDGCQEADYLHELGAEEIQEDDAQPDHDGRFSPPRWGPPRPYRDNRNRCIRPTSIDFRESAPSGSHPRMFAPENFEGSELKAKQASRIGGMATGVPGELRGMEQAYQISGGGVSWKRLFDINVELAREFKVGKELARRLKATGDFIFRDPTWTAVFAPDGKLLEEGDIARRPTYADTLSFIGENGPTAFYTGKIAESIVETVQNAEPPGSLTLTDMARYRAIVKPALWGTYRGRTLYTTHAPGGGPILLSLLNIIEGWVEFATGNKDGLSIHRFIEALKFSFATRTEIGDPEYIKNEKRLAEIIEKGFAAQVRANITDDETHRLSYYNPHFDAIVEDHGTTHISVVDKWGGSIALTSTVNLLFGNQVMDPTTGVVLNSEMDDFSTVGIPDAFGLHPSPFNYPEPRKRPLSSTSPIIIEDEAKNFWLSLGGSGGSRIFGSCAQVLLNLDYGYDLSNAVETPRVHHQLLPAFVSAESGIRPDLIDALKSRGHNVTLFDINLGIAEVQAVMKADGRFFATSDSRKNGLVVMNLTFKARYSVGLQNSRSLLMIALVDSLLRISSNGT